MKASPATRVPFIMQKENRLFAACILALAATAFGFIVRTILLNTLGVAFDLSESEKGALVGAGLFPFALSIMFFSLIIERIGYGRAMAFAWFLHVLSAIVTISARNYNALYFGTLLFSLANGIIEAVVNPVTAALYPKCKTPRLIMLHSGWAAGLVLGGLMAIALSKLGWRWKIGLFLVPTILYGLMMRAREFPMPERVGADVSYVDMIRELGWAGCLIICTFSIYAVNEVFMVFGPGILPVGHSFLVAVAYAAVPTLYCAIHCRAFGRPMFIFLLLIMVLLAATELGTGSWIPALLTPVLKSLGTNAGNWVFVYTAAITLVLRFFAGLLARRFSPVSLLSGCALLSAVGLFCLSHAGTSAPLVFAAATLYGVGTSLSWPTMIGLASEQFPRGGALTLNAISAVGMISVGVLGGPFLGTVQDVSLDRNLHRINPALHAVLAEPAQHKFGFIFQPLDKDKIKSLSVADGLQMEEIVAQTNQTALAKIAILPAIMFGCFIGLGLFFWRRGGYREIELARPQEAIDSSRPIQVKATPVIDKLRIATRSRHAALSASPAMARLFDDGYTLAEYRAHLGRLLGLFEPLERAVMVAADPTDPVLKLLRSSDLRRDLFIMGSSSADIDAIERCREVPAITREGLLGYGYVSLGSRLGGKIIAKRLRTVLGSEASVHFYGDVDGRAGILWEALCLDIEAQGADHSEAICATAVGIFDTYMAWLSEQSGSPGFPDGEGR